MLGVSTVYLNPVNENVYTEQIRAVAKKILVVDLKQTSS